MDVYDVVVKRRSIRRFKEKAVPYAALEKCIDAARLAPSAMNCQLCEYLIVDDKELLPRVLNAVAYWSGVPRPKWGWSTQSRPQVYIVSLINNFLAEELGAGGRNVDFDAALAMENIVLVALEQGLGSCVITGINKDRLRQALNIPQKYKIAMLLALGYPDESPLVEVAEGSIKRWQDESGVRHIPKRRLADIMHLNKLS
jgi:nitroreductase